MSALKLDSPISEFLERIRLIQYADDFAALDVLSVEDLRYVQEEDVAFIKNPVQKRKFLQQKDEVLSPNNNKRTSNFDLPAQTGSTFNTPISIDEPNPIDRRNCVIALENFNSGFNQIYLDHTIHHCEKTSFLEPVGYALVYANKQDTLIIAFKCPQKIFDVMKIRTGNETETELEVIAESFPLSHVESAKYKKIIFTGYGFAGAVATHVCLRALKRLKVNLEILCITFGSFIMTRKNTQIKGEFTKHFFHYIHEDDILPALFLVSESARLLIKGDNNNMNRYQFLVDITDKILNGTYQPKTRFTGEKCPINKFLEIFGDSNIEFMMIGSYFIVDSSVKISRSSENLSQREMFGLLPLPKVKKIQLVQIIKNLSHYYFSKYFQGFEMQQEPKTLLAHPVPVHPLITHHPGEIKARATVYGDKTIVIIESADSKTQNLEFTTSVMIPFFDITCVPIFRSPDKARGTTQEVQVCVRTYFGETFGNIPKDMLNPREKSKEERLNVIIKMGPGQILFKSLIFYALQKKLGNAKICHKIEILFEGIQYHAKNEDFILSLCYTNRIKRFVQRLEVDEAAFWKEIYKMYKVENNTLPAPSFYKNFENDLPTKLLHAFAEQAVNLSNETKKDFHGEKTTLWKATFKGSSESRKERINFADLDAHEDVKKDMLKLNTLDFILEKPVEIRARRKVSTIVALNLLALPLHLLFVPFDVISSVVGLAVGAAVGVYDSVITSNLASMNLAKEGLQEGLLMFHRIVYQALLLEDKVINNWKDKLLFIANAVVGDVGKLISINEDRPDSEHVYLLEKEIAQIDEKTVNSLVSRYNNMNILGSGVKIGETLNLWITQIKSIESLRKILMDTSGIAVMGTGKTGKSTLLNKMWGLDTKPSSVIPTSTIVPYSLRGVENFYILDFPGSDEVSNLLQECSIDGIELVSFFIFVFDCKYINSKQKEIVDVVCEKKIPFIVCLNKADELCENLRREGNVSDMETKLKDVLIDRLKRFGPNPLVTEKNCFLTCFETPREILPSIVKGIDFLKKEIQDKLVEQNLFRDKVQNIMTSTRIFRRNGDLDGNNSSLQGMDLYDYEKEIARNGSGRLHLVKNKQAHSNGVLKSIVLHEPYFEKVHSEYRRFFSLNHPYIAVPRQLFFDDYHSIKVLHYEYQYYDEGDIMENISKRIKSGSKYFTQKEILDYLGQMSNCLYCLHSQKPPIVHCSISPTNIFFEKKNGMEYLVLGDFGYAKQFVETTFTQPNIVYRAPEVTPKTETLPKEDIWSMGCVFFEMCTLTITPLEPYAVVKMSQSAIREKIMDTEVYDKTLAEIIAQMMEIDPNKRISSDELYKKVSELVCDKFDHINKQVEKH